MGSSDSSISLPLEDRAAHEQRRISLAPTFDRLTSSNLLLTLQVSRLVQLFYASMVMQILVLAFLSFVVMSRRP